MSFQSRPALGRGDPRWSSYLDFSLECSVTCVQRARAAPVGQTGRSIQFSEKKCDPVTVPAALMYGVVSCVIAFCPSVKNVRIAVRN